MSIPDLLQILSWLPPNRLAARKAPSQEEDALFQFTQRLVPLAESVVAPVSLVSRCLFSFLIALSDRLKINGSSRMCYNINKSVLQNR